MARFSSSASSFPQVSPVLLVFGAHVEGLTRDELDAYLAQQIKAAGVSQPLFDETARQGMYQATKGLPRKVNKLAMTALRLAAASKPQTVNEAILLDATAEALL